MVRPMGAAFRKTETYSSWGRVTRGAHEVARPHFSDELAGLVAGLSPDAPGLATGLRRSYGDSNLNPGGRVIDMTALDRLILFDRATGVMRAEAGTSLSQIISVLAPWGWFLPTTPGTRFVTLGGAVANDVHGKNHHSAGSFGNWVTRIKLLRTDGGIHEVAPGDPLFHATIGGLGLTGVIEWVEFRAVPIRSTFIDAEDASFSSAGDYFELAKEKQGSEHTVAWVDCAAGGGALGRGIYSSGDWSAAGGYRAHEEEPKKKMPADTPGFALNPFSVAAYNTLRHALKTSIAGRYHPHYDSFFYPLDGIANWNRLYGSQGFYQYQCVVPHESAKEATGELLKRIARSGQASFLAVLKDMGPVEAVGMLSFPREGTTLALDFPNRGAKTLKLMAELDEVVAQAGGRLYPAKDGRIPPEMFQAGFPKWQEFRVYVDPGLSSAFWRRVSA